MSGSLRLRNILVKGEQSLRLRIADLTIRSGERIGILGDTGAGKTTLLTVLGHVLEPSEGTIERTPGFMTSLALQTPEQAFLSDTVVTEIGGPGAPDNERITSERLSNFGMKGESFYSRDPFSLSGGEARRIALAATQHSPDTLLLWDEPTAGLDVLGCTSIVAVLRNHPGGFVVASHDTGFLYQTCERWIGLVRGEIVWDVSPGAIASDSEKMAMVGHFPVLF